jgi:ribosomal protein S27E
MPISENVQCPGCGATSEVVSPAILQITCPYCESIFTWDHELTKDSGKKSKLIPPHSGLYISAQVQYKNKTYSVIGRVQYGYSHSSGETTGVWDEWYLFDGSTELWLTDDSGSFSIEELISETPKLGKLSTGDRFDFQGNSYLISETGNVQCMGTAGMLPFQILPEESYYYADAIAKENSNNDILSIEYDEEKPSFYRGIEIDSSELKYQREESFLKSPKTNTVTLKCSSCGSPLKMIGKDLLTIVCDSCNTINQIDESTAIALGKSPTELGEKINIKLASMVRIFDTDYIVTGRLYYEWTEEDEGEYETGSVFDYLLYNAEKGYLYITEENNKFTAYSTTSPPSISMKDSFSENGNFLYETKKYKFIESGSQKLIYVDGALPWIAKIDSIVQYTDAKSGNTLLSEDITLDDAENPREIEYFKGKAIPKEEILKSFPDLNIGNRPITKIPGEKFLKYFSIAASIILLSLLFALDNSESILTENYKQSDLLSKEVYSKPFEIQRVDETIEIKIETNVDDSWTHLGVALYNTKNVEVISGEDLGIEYYSGVDDGESWSEGSKSESIYWKIKDPGNYQIILTAFGGETPLETTSIKMEVLKNASQTWPFIIISILWLTIPLMFFIKNQVSSSTSDYDEDEGD